MKTKIIILILFIVSTLAKNEDYMGYKVYKIKLSNETQQDDLYKLKSDIVDFWRKPCAKYNVIGKAMVPPSHIDWFEEQLNEIGIEKDIFIDDVHMYLAEKEQKSAEYKNKLSDNKSPNDEEKIDCDVDDNECSDESGDSNATEEDDIVFDFNSYYRYDIILAHLYALEDAYANSPTTIKVVVYGYTAENRPLVYLKLTNGDEADKPVTVIESAINPRDWITVPSALNVVNRLLEEGNRSYLDETVWIIVPVLNPDGYEYTHTNLRLWTKSRSLRSNLGFICPGVNLDRNFDIDWQISDSSSSPCSHLFAGIDTFSEIETQMIKHIIEEYTPVLYISLQSTGKFITYPWRYEKAASGLFRPHLLKGLDIVNALDGYTLDSGAIAIGDRESGTSVDYARLHRVYYAYNVGIDGDGNDGVLVPEEDIKRITEDVWRAVAAAAKDLTV